MLTACALVIKTRAHAARVDEAEMLETPWFNGFVKKQNSTG